MEIVLSPHAYRQYKRFPRSIQSLVKSSISDLGKNTYPTNSKKLSDREGYRLRYGNYRIIYEVDKKSKLITILAIAHRREVYKK